MKTFLIVGYPRSRTAWLANFLTYGNVACGHEMLVDCEKPKHLGRHVQVLGKPFSGSAETAAALFMPQILEKMPDSPVVFVKRKVEDVAASFVRLGMDGDVRLLEAGLNFALKLPQTLTIRFEDLNSLAVCRLIQNHVAPGEPFNVSRFQMLRDFNIQITPRRWQVLAIAAQHRFAST